MKRREKRKKQSPNSRPTVAQEASKWLRTAAGGEIANSPDAKSSLLTSEEVEAVYGLGEGCTCRNTHLGKLGHSSQDLSIPFPVSFRIRFVKEEDLALLRIVTEEVHRKQHSLVQLAACASEVVAPSP